jgi:hypothetical protein
VDSADGPGPEMFTLTSPLCGKPIIVARQHLSEI